MVILWCKNRIHSDLEETLQVFEDEKKCTYFRRFGNST